MNPAEQFKCEFPILVLAWIFNNLNRFVPGTHKPGRAFIPYIVVCAASTMTIAAAADLARAT